jgi:hypothetical protein
MQSQTWADYGTDLEGFQYEKHGWWEHGDLD